MENLITQWLEAISSIITVNIWLAPLLALLAGILNSFTPCSISSVPLVIGYVTGTGGSNIKRSFILSVIFSAGKAVTFTILGSLASLFGKLMQGTGSWWYIALGILMLLMALQIWGIFDLIPSTNALSKNTRRGFFGAFLAGILAGLFSTPCSTPVLIALLAIVAEKGSLLWGIMLLLLYSIGHSALVIIAGTSIGFVQKLSDSEKYSVASRILRIIMGMIIVLVALYLFYLGF